MKKSTKYKLLLFLLIPLVTLLTYWYAAMPNAWEEIYSMGINKFMIQGLSLIFGIFPFSVFEFFIYTAVLLIIIYPIYLIVKIIKNRKVGWRIFFNGLLNVGVVITIFFSAFILMWGLNYKRPQFGISEKIVAGEYTTEQLGELYSYLLNQAAQIRTQLPEDENGAMQALGDYKDIFKRAQLGYDVAGEKFIELTGDYGIAKPILASKWLNYTGITGIYSPFTGEPNVNIAILDLNLPVTTCHEMAHQRGYGFEDQCNFIAYLTCVMHPDLDFQYSGYILAISYISNALASSNYPLLLELNNNMSDEVRFDLNYHNDYWTQFDGDVQEISNNINSSYLQANGVQSGTNSYGKVVDLLLAYYDKFY